MEERIKTLSDSKKNRLLLHLLPNLTYNTWISSEEYLNELIGNEWGSMVQTFNPDVYEYFNRQEGSLVDMKELYYTLLRLDEQDPGKLDEILNQQDYERIVEGVNPALQDLPYEIMLSVLSGITVQEIEKLCKTSIQLNEYCTVYGWKEIFRTKYPTVYKITGKQDIDYRLVLKRIENKSPPRTFTGLVYYLVHEKDEVAPRFYILVETIAQVDTVLPYLEDDEVQIVFNMAVINGNLVIVNYMLEDDRVDPSSDDNYAIKYSIDVSNLEVVIRLLEDNRVDPSIDNNYVIKTAAEKGYAEVVDRLLEDDRVDPSVGNNYAIKIAAERGHEEVVDRLLEDDRVDPSAGNNHAITQASFNGHEEVVDRLLEDDRVDPSARNNDAIIDASYNGHVKVVDRLLEDDRVDPSAQNNQAIIQAAGEGHFDVVDLLLEDDRVDPTADNYDAVRLAVKNNHEDVIKRLLEDDRIDKSFILTKWPFLAEYYE